MHNVDRKSKACVMYSGQKWGFSINDLITRVNNNNYKCKYILRMRAKK